MNAVHSRNPWLAALVAIVSLACTSAAPSGGDTKPAAPTASAPVAAPAAPIAPVAVAAPQAAPAKVRVALVPGTPPSGVYLGIARGYFAEQGLEVEYEPFDAGERTIPSLATGQIDVSASGLSAGLYGAVARGAELRVVAGQTS